MRRTVFWVIAAAAAWVATADAQSWQHDIEASVSQPRSVRGATPLSDGGVAVRTMTHVSELDGNDQVLAEETVRFRPAFGLFDDTYGIAYFEYGSDVGDPTPLVQRCHYEKTSTGLVLRSFSPALAPSFMPGNVQPFLDGEGGHFAVVLQSSGIGDHFVARFGPDCAMTRLLDLGPVNALLANIPDAPAAFMLSSAYSNAEPDDRLSRIDESGLAWSRPLAEGLGSIGAGQLSATSDGDALIAARSGDLLYLARVRGDGSLAWESTLPDVEGSPVALQARGDGMIVVTRGWAGGPPTDQQDAAYGIDGAGELLWQTSLAPQRFESLVPSVARPVEEWHWVLREYVPSFGVSGAGRVVRPDASGALETLFPLEFWNLVLGERPDHTTLLGIHDGTASVLHEIAAGDESPRPVPVADAPAAMRVEILARHGDDLLVVTEVADGSAGLHRIDAQGLGLWSHEFAPVTELGNQVMLAGHQWSLGSSANAVCVARRLAQGPRQSEILCFDAASGTPRFGPVSLDEAAHYPPLLHVADDGSVLAFVDALDCLDDPCTPGVRRISIDAEGNVVGVDTLAHLAPEEWARMLKTSDGGVIVALRLTTAAELVRFDAAGAEVWRFQTDVAYDQLHALRLHPDGSVLFAGRTGSVVELILIEVDGTQRWTRHLGGKVPTQSPQPIEDGWLLLFDDTEGSEIQGIALADGADLWPAVSRWHSPHPLHVTSTPDGRRFALTHQVNESVRGHWFDAADGRLLGSIEALAAGSLQGVLLDASGGLVMAGSSRDAERSRILLARYAPESVDTVSLDAMHLAGAWYTPATDGQGLVLDVQGDAATLFGAWFTYTAGGGHQPSELRWYSLQGDIPESGDVVELAILRNQGGAFASPPITVAEQVGTAWLSRSTCDRIQLHYEFTADVLDGRQGSQVLLPLIGVGAQCPSAPLPAVAEATRAWFDPATSGQGLLVDARQGDGDGVFFGAWFTYDPDFAMDDPTAQHWFTVQGAWQDGVAGELELFRTIGGGFDAQSTDNTQRVGEASFEVLSCDQARFVYRFDPGQLAGQFAELEGEILLSGLGDCE